LSIDEDRYTLGVLQNFPKDTHCVVSVANREIGIFNIDEKLYALPNICPHQIGPLCMGEVSGTLIANKEGQWQPEWKFDGQIISCAWHGLEFHIPTGQCIALPQVRLRTYEVWVEDNIVFMSFRRKQGKQSHVKD
jgi:nitrite reductase (NADH) small subunit